MEQRYDLDVSHTMVICIDSCREWHIMLDPSRVDILRAEARKTRERQQQEMQKQIKANEAAMAEKKKLQKKVDGEIQKKKNAPSSREYNPLQGIKVCACVFITTIYVSLSLRPYIYIYIYRHILMLMI